MDAATEVCLPARMQIARRPRLGLGVRVLRHGADQWQVGLGPERRVRLPDSPDVRRTLSALRRAALACDSDAGVLARLADHRLLHDDAPTDDDGRRVLVHRFGHGEVPDPSVALERAGLRPVATSQAAEGAMALALLVGFGEPARSLVDGWLREAVPHLVVRLHPTEAVVGPLVVPGHGACLRCLDAYRTDEDPRWPQLVHQHAALDERGRLDGLVDRADPVLGDLALAWAARDLSSHLAGLPVPTRSATLHIPRDLGDLELVAWHQHPECVCTW